MYEVVFEADTAKFELSRGNAESKSRQRKIDLIAKGVFDILYWAEYETIFFLEMFGKSQSNNIFGEIITGSCVALKVVL